MNLCKWVWVAASRFAQNLKVAYNFPDNTDRTQLKTGGMKKMKRVAVVDDNRDIFGNLEDMVVELEIEGVSLFYFPGGTEILEALKEGESFDLILMDGKLSDGYTGPKYAEQIIRDYPGIMVAGFTDATDLLLSLREKGVQHFLSKVGVGRRTRAEELKTLLGI